MYYVVMDLEFNQAFDFDGLGAADVEDCRFEVIQLGAVVMNERFEATGRRNIRVKPVIYPRMHPVVEGMTRLTNAVLSVMPTFPEVFDEIAALLPPRNSVICTWGGSDVRLLNENIRFYGLDASRITRRYINVQQIASRYLKHGAGRQVGLKNAVEELNIHIGNPFHDAVNDAVYTAKVFEIVKYDSVDIKTYTFKDARPQHPPLPFGLGGAEAAPRNNPAS